MSCSVLAGRLCRGGECRPRQCRGFTLVELLVVICILAVLAAALFPVFARAREGGRKARCLSNERQLGLGLILFAQDHDGHLPYHLWAIGQTSQFRNWLSGLKPYCHGQEVYECPTNRGDTYTGDTDVTLSYVYNRDLNGRRVTRVAQPSRTIVSLDGVQVSCSYSGGDTFRDTDQSVYQEDPNTGKSPNRVIFSRHNAGGNALYLDGHGKWLKPTDVRPSLQVR